MRILHRRRPSPARPAEPLHPRLAALDLLREKLGTGQAGVDPYDETIFVLQARDTEIVWARRALELCGVVLDQTIEGRFRAILKPDVRAELGLDTVGRALMLDEPLASRGVDATLRALELAPEPVSLRAVRDARAAYDQRSNR